MTKNKKTFGIVALIILATLIGYWASNSIPKANSSAPPGSQTAWATSSTITLSNATAYTLFATSTSGCISRTVSTRISEIIIKIGDSAAYVLDNNRGHFQGASTTVTYDAALYGCGLWTAINYNATTSPVTVTEFQGFR